MLAPRRSLSRSSPLLAGLLFFAACGGGTSTSPVEPPSCEDGVRNGSETDVDCGGDTCAPCARGMSCEEASDCATGECRARRCVAPASCEDGVRNNGESAIDCGGPDCEPCADGKSCDRASDCESLVCLGGSCIPAKCGDGVVQKANGEECDPGEETAKCNADCTKAVCGDGKVNEAAGEECDDGGESAECNADCTKAVCGDGKLNEAAGEECDEGGGPVYSRCGSRCFIGAGLDGTFGDEWEELASHASTRFARGLQSFHYSGQPYIYDISADRRYHIAMNSWSARPDGPHSPSFSEAGCPAVSDTMLWLPRGGLVHQFDLVNEEWSVLGGDMPVSVPATDAFYSNAVFDSAGNLWYHDGTLTNLVRLDPSSGEYQEFVHETAAMPETRVAYDPVTERILFGPYVGRDHFLIFDIATEEFSASSPNPGGELKNNTCQDRSGGVYVGSTDLTEMYRYDVAQDSWTPLPPPPVPHDNWSACTVSEDGYLYYATQAPSGNTLKFFRLPLGRR